MTRTTFLSSQTERPWLFLLLTCLMITCASQVVAAGEISLADQTTHSDTGHHLRSRYWEITPSVATIQLGEPTGQLSDSQGLRLQPRFLQGTLAVEPQSGE